MQIQVYKYSRKQGANFQFHTRLGCFGEVDGLAGTFGKANKPPVCEGCSCVKCLACGSMIKERNRGTHPRRDCGEPSHGVWGHEDKTLCLSRVLQAHKFKLWRPSSKVIPQGTYMVSVVVFLLRILIYLYIYGQIRGLVDRKQYKFLFHLSVIEGTSMGSMQPMSDERGPTSLQNNNLDGCLYWQLVIVRCEL